MNKHHKVNISCTRALTEMPSPIVIATENNKKQNKKTTVSPEKNKIKRKQNEFEEKKKIKRKERKTCFAFLLL